MKNRFLLLAAFAASFAVTNTSKADIVIDNLDPAAGTYGEFTATIAAGTPATISFTNSGSSDLDGGGADDTLAFDIVYGYHTVSSFSGTSPSVTTVLGTASAPTTTGQNFGASNFGGGGTLSFSVENIVYTSGEADGTTVVFDGFTDIRRINTGGSINFAVGSGLTGQTLVATTGASAIDLSSLGNSTQLFLTSDGAASNTTRLRDLDLQFSTVAAAVPEPSSLALLGLGGLFLASRRRRA